MTLSRYIFTTLVLLRPWSRNDETLTTFSHRRTLNPWIQRPLAPFVSLTVLAALTFYLVEMSYFPPPKVSDAAPRQTTSLALPKKIQPIRRAQTESPQSTPQRGWMRKMMIPSRRPERGGTSREQGFWEQMEVEGKVRPRRRMTDSQYSMGDVSADSSYITRWNVPKDIPKEQPHTLPRRRHVIPAKSRSSLPPITKQNNRSWSWSPQKSSGDQISVTKWGGALPSNDWNGNNNLAEGVKATKTSGLSMDSETATHKTQLQRRDALRARKARRRQRQSLRESGDFLGVQGVNPHTRELDVMSPTDSSPMSTISHQETVHSVMTTLRDKWKSSRYHNTRVTPSKDKYIKGNDTKLSGLQKEKKSARHLGKTVKFKRRQGEWSSLQEPNLSPISASPNSRRPSHAQGLQQSVQNLFLEESQPNPNPPNDTLTFVNDPVSHIEATSPDTVSNPLPNFLTRTSSNSTELHKGGLNFNDSHSQASSKATSQSMMAPFLDMIAEREVGKPCTGASMITLSACQFTQSIPDFHQKVGLRGVKAIRLSNLDLSLTPLREPIPLSLFEESPLGAISRLRYRDSPTRTKRRRPKGPSSLINVQTIETDAVKSLGEVTGLLQERPVTTKHLTSSPSPHSLLTPEEIKKDMQKLRDQVTVLNNQQRKELSHHLHQTNTQQKSVNHILCEIADKVDEIKETVYIPITTTTGCDHQTSPSASHQKELYQKELYQEESLEHLLSHMVQPGELSYSSPIVGLSRNNSDKSHTDLSTSSAPSRSSVEGDELLVELLADTTSMKQEAHMAQEERAHLRGRRLLMSEAMMPAQEDSSLPKSTFTQGQALIATNQWKLSNTKQMTQELNLNTLPSTAERQTHMVEENPWAYPEEEGSDNIASLLDDWEHFQDSCPDAKLPVGQDGGEWKIFTEWEEYWRQNQRESTGLQFFLYCLKSLAKLYWSTVWPMLDPRTLQVEHDGPMPFWKACLLIVLAAPVVTVGFVVIAQGIKIVRLVAWLLDYADDGAAIWI
ncbi:hypothetical protein GGI43DRAFT_423742 [Trichoderma evansii]